MNDVSVVFMADYLGSQMQIPVLAKAINEEMPNATFTLRRCEDTLATTSPTPIVQSFLKYGLEQPHLDSGTTESPCDVRISISVGNGGITNGTYCFHEKDHSRLHATVWIDPLKYEKRPLLSKEEQEELKQRYNLQKGPILVGGSLGSKEVKYFLDATSQIKDKYCDLQAIVTMRGTRYEDPVRGFAQERGLSFSSDEEEAQHKSDIVLVREKGILPHLYSMADVAVVGDTFERLSTGQNPLEPAFYGKRIVSGSNFLYNAKAYLGLKKSGLLRSSSKEDLADTILEALEAPGLEMEQNRARRFIESRQGFASCFAISLRHELEGAPLTQEKFIEEKNISRRFSS